MRLLKFTLLASAMAADTCSNDVTGDDTCTDDLSALQADVKRHDKIIPVANKQAGAPEAHFSTNIDVASEHPEPSKQCSSLLAKGFFKTAQAVVNGILSKIASDHADVSKTSSADVRVWKNWLTKCETYANMSVTGEAAGLDGLSLSEFECIDTNTLNTVFQVYLEMAVPSLTFSGTGSFKLDRESEHGRCIVGDKLLPQVAATIGATADTITLGALVNVSNLKPIDVSDIQFHVAHIGDFKCGALTEPISLEFLNEVCSVFLTPVANLLLKPITNLINKALNAAAAKHFNQTANLVEEPTMEHHDVGP